MINQDFAEFPEHRVGFFKLLRAINLHCFPGEIYFQMMRVLHTDEQNSALLGVPPPQFKLFMDSIIWAIKHTMRDIADTGLNCELLASFINRFATDCCRCSVY
jgi:exportin-1